MLKVYGIPNCDTVKKALSWLKEHRLEYEFHNFKKLGIGEEKLENWSKKIPWESMLNKRGSTWKKLDLAVQQTITNQSAAFKLMQEKPSIIKRPVIELKNNIIAGFDEDNYKKMLL